MSGALVVFAKRPAPGEVKTRLCPPLRPEQAAAFYAAMLDDVLEASHRACAALDLEPVLAVHPPDAAGELPAPKGWRQEPQRGPDLGARMEHAASHELDAGRTPVLLRGSDSPTLGQPTLAAALDALRCHDLVICPDRDGGYNLVGLRRPAPGLFTHPMSTGTELDDTLARAKRLGLTTHLLAPGFDIDTAEDLHLLAEARKRGETKDCPRTIAWLDQNGLWPS
ncbi:MAG: TIGR04282 family arsenosugar biosynthesis glycosyltransferase [Myxococcota bacterium]